VNINEFKNLKNLWWSLLNKVNDFRWVWFLIEAQNFVDCWDWDWFAEHCFFLRLNTFFYSSMIISSWVFIVVWLIFSSASLLMWSTCRSIHYSLSFKVMFCWFLSSISILMISSDWSMLRLSLETNQSACVTRMFDL